MDKKLAKKTIYLQTKTNSYRKGQMTQREQPRVPKLQATVIENHFLMKELENRSHDFYFPLSEEN